MRGNQNATSSEDDDTDFKDIPFPQDTAIQQVRDVSVKYFEESKISEPPKFRGWTIFSL